MSRADMIEKRRQLRESWSQKTEEEQLRKEEEESRKRGGFIPPKYTDLKAGGYTLLRFVGDEYPRPYDKVESSYDPVSFEEGLLKDDEEKLRTIRIKYGDSKHILKKMYYMISEKKSDIHIHADSPLFPLINKNIDGYANKGWVFKKYVGWNVIDRSKMDWHKQHNQTLLITRNLVDGKGGNVFPSNTGIPISVFEKKSVKDEETGQIVKNDTILEVASQYGWFGDYDILVWRKKYNQSEGMQPKAIWYKAIKASDRIEKIDASEKSFWDISDINKPYDDFEAGLKKYNLQMLCKPTKWKTIKKWFGKTIKAFDVEFKTSFYEELERNIEREEEQESILYNTSLFVTDYNEPVEDDDMETTTKDTFSGESKPEEKKQSDDSHMEKFTKDEPFESKESEPVKRVARRTASEGSEKSIREKLVDAGYLVDKLSDDQLDAVTAVKDDGEIVWKDSSENLDCPECGFKAPEDWNPCAKCGVVFED